MYFLNEVNMFNTFFQSWGAIFFLFNKVFLSISERASNNTRKKKWLVLSWIVYLIGLPVWIIVFISESNWIAACVETAGVPAMIIGLYNALNGHEKELIWLDYLAKIFVVIGLCVSMYDFGGIASIKQMLELGIASGFLIGTYCLAKQKQQQGYIWFIVGNVTCAILMGMEEFFILMIQQIVSLVFVMDAYLVNRRNLSKLKASL